MNGSRGTGASGSAGESPDAVTRHSRGLLAALLVSAPVWVGVGYALLAALGAVGVGAGEVSARRFPRVLGETAVWEGVGWTVWVAAASTALATAAAALVAVAFRASGRTDRLARSIAVFPLPIPHIVAAVGGVLVLGQSGFLARVARAAGLIDAPADMPALVYDEWGIGLILTLAWKEFPFLALVAFSVLSSRGNALEETARSLGAGPWQCFRRVTWPVLWRGILPAVIAVFTFVAGTYEAMALLAPSDPLALPLLTMERYTDAALTRRGDAFVLVLLAMALAAVAVILHERVRSRWERLES